MKILKKIMALVVTLMIIAVIVLSDIPFLNPAVSVNAATTTVTYNSKTYTTTSGNDMAYRKESTTFDFIGNYNGTWKRVTYGTNGFSSIMTVSGTKYTDINISNGNTYGGLKVNVGFTFAKDGSLQITYSVTNTTSSSKTFSLGSHADVQIGTDDSAPITPFSTRTADGKIKGFMMNESSSGAQFNFYARGYSGVTTVDSIWYGRYSDRQTNIYNECSGSSLTNTDSGMAWSWQNRTIPGNATQDYNVKFVIAEKGSENNVASSGTISLIRIGSVQHTFNVYQLMEGTLNNYNTYNSVLKWGSSISSYRTLAGNTVSTTKGSVVSIPILKEFVESDENTEKTALIERMTLGTPIRSGTSVNGSIAFPNLESGYYLVRDVTSFSESSEDIVSRDMLIYLGDEGVAIEIKRVKPSFDKVVAKDGVLGNEWSEAADYGFGEDFNIKLTATIPANEDFGGYSQYKLVFNETYTDGIDFENISSVSYTVGSLEAQEIASENYSFVQDGNGFVLTINDFRAVAGSAWGSSTNAIKVDVIYTAKLNTDAPVISATTTDATYSAASKVSSTTGYLQYTNNAQNYSSLGKTSSDTVGVFSYRMINTKYGNFAEDGYQLDGAKFKIYRNSKSDENEMKMVYDAALKAYRPALQGETAVDVMISGYGLDDEGLKGKLDIAGIDSGDYIIVETEAPEGYTAIEDFAFSFTAIPEEKQTGTVAVNTLSVTRGNDSSDSEDKGTQAASSYTLQNDIIDTITSNNLLPETGGIGTKLFYITGISMILLAGVTLIVRKRLTRSV
ncbi:MAG: SpaA isopeptide-forming pilin-related protein [Lachnospira sp.]